MRIFNFIVFILVSSSEISFAAFPVAFCNVENIREIGARVQIFEDPTNQLTAPEVLASGKFIESNMKVPNPGITSSSFWIKFEINNRSDAEALLLELAQPATDEVELYTVLPDGKFLVEKAGVYQPFSYRKYPHPNYLFDLRIPKNKTVAYLMKMRSRGPVQAPLSIGEPKLMLDSYLKVELITGIYFGLIAVMFLYNLLIYIAVGDTCYLQYVFYILMMGLTQIGLQGYAFKYLWPNIPWLAGCSLFLFPPLAGIGGIVFLKTCIRTKECFRPYNKIGYALIGTFIVGILLSFIGLFQISYVLVEINAMIVLVFSVYVSYRVLQKRDPMAKVFLLGWSIFLIGTVVFVLKDYGILPYNYLTRYSMQAGFAIQLILLSFALVDRINILTREKENLQLNAIEALKENKRITKEQKLTKNKIIVRTTESSEMFQHLKETQSQMASAEKMASLGQLTAGIAHEINNPINFVMSNITPLKRDIKDVFSIFSKYEEITLESDLKQKLTEINILKEELDTDLLIEEINSLLNGIHDGASRTSEIVRGMRNFSRLDGYDLKKADINEGLDRTLSLLKNVLPGKIQVRKSLGNLPQIECNPVKLNQVFMNIIFNGIQAITQKKSKTDDGIIEISSTLEGSNIIINIRDNGIGMSSITKKKIFEPFFTTKEVGVGTGLGLSIGYSIIKSHGGDIKVESEEGQGSNFSIILPINQQ